MRHLPNFENTRSGSELAAAFGWSHDDLSAQAVRRGETVIDVQKGTISGEPAAVFGTVINKNGYDPLDCVALYAYHSSAPWGVLADEVGLTVFNSQWLNDQDWFRLPRIAWDNINPNRELLSSLTPSGLLDRQPARLVTKIREPSDFLKPVDDSLVERLDRWRDQALRYARQADKIDQLLQTFYAQLFVLRTVEDRGLDERVEPASSAAPSSDRFDRFDRRQWDLLMQQARERIGSDLFDHDVTIAIPEHVLSGVVKELYQPYKVPGPSPRYNFAWIDADVLGLAYEKYLASVLQPTSLPSQVDLFLPAERTFERYSVRKSAGAYYTPRYITDYVSSATVEDYLKSSNTALPRIIDFACGSGSFLVAAIDKLLRHLKKKDPNRAWAKELVNGGHIVGIDIDSKAVTAARLHLWQRMIEEPDALPLPSLAKVVITADGLDSSTWGELDRKYDIVLGNPPFLATNLVSSREDLEARFATARGRYDFSSLFVEQALNILSNGGTLGLVVPNRLFRNKSGAPLRRMLTEKAHLQTIVDFGTTKPFDADAYVGCIIAQLNTDGVPPPSKVRVIEVRSLDAEFLASMLISASNDALRNEASTLRAFLARHPTGDAPWILLSDADQLSRILIEEVSVRLDTIAAIPQGIRTGGNDFFYVALEADDGGPLSRVVNGLGEGFIIESELLEDSVYGSQVKRYENTSTPYRLIYPYRDNVAISEAELERRYPHAWSYFQRNREILSARASLKKSNGRFYELVWPRDESWLRRPKLIIRDLAPTTAFAIDPAGRIFLVGGTAVVPNDPEFLFALLAYLNSSVINNLVRQTTPQFRGSFQKFEPQHIQGIPVLDRMIEDPQIVDQLSHYALAIIETPENSEARQTFERKVDSLVRSVGEERGVALSTN